MVCLSGGGRYWPISKSVFYLISLDSACGCVMCVLGWIEMKVGKEGLCNLCHKMSQCSFLTLKMFDDAFSSGGLCAIHVLNNHCCLFTP